MESESGSSFLFEHDLFSKTGSHFAGSCASAHVLLIRRDNEPRTRALALFLLLTAQMATGIAALMLGTPAGLSILHQVGGIFVLAGAFVLLRSPARAGES